MNLEVINLTKSFDGRPVLSGLSHTFPEGRVSCILGRSGVGKTTLLRLVAGLEKPDAGRVLGVPEGGLSMLFQEDRLPPQLTAAGCLRCVLPKAPDREARIEEALRALEVNGEPDQPVREFSGGMARRVALARALLYPSPLVLLDEPFKGLDYPSPLVLLDEPFKGLDAATRDRAVAFARPLLAGRTTLLVTHDEADVSAFDADVLRL